MGGVSKSGAALSAGGAAGAGVGAGVVRVSSAFPAAGASSMSASARQSILRSFMGIPPENMLPHCVPVKAKTCLRGAVRTRSGGGHTMAVGAPRGRPPTRRSEDFGMERTLNELRPGESARVRGAAIALRREDAGLVCVAAREAET